MKELIELGRKMLKNKHYVILRVKLNRRSEERFEEIEKVAEKNQVEAEDVFRLLETENLFIDRLSFSDNNIFYLINIETNKENITILIHDNERRFEYFLMHEKMKERQDKEMIKMILIHLKENYKKQFDYTL